MSNDHAHPPHRLRVLYPLGGDSDLEIYQRLKRCDPEGLAACSSGTVGRCGFMNFGRRYCPPACNPLYVGVPIIAGTKGILIRRGKDVSACGFDSCRGSFFALMSTARGVNEKEGASTYLTFHRIRLRMAAS